MKSESYVESNKSFGVAPKIWKKSLDFAFVQVK